MDIHNYEPLFIVLVIAWLVPFVLSWLEITKVPAVIVMILAGVIIGPFVLDLIPETQYMNFLANTGFLFLIFLSGLEIDVDKIISSLPKHRLKLFDFMSNSLLIATTIFVGCLLLAVPFAYMSHQLLGINTVFYAILFPTAALGITVPILKSDGQLTRKFGQVLLMEGAIATIVSIILISIYSGVLKNGFQVEILLFTVIFAVFTITYIAGKRLMSLRTFQRLLYTLEHAASQIRVRGAVALMLLFIVVAHLIETELIMGAFFAGILLSLFVVKERSSLLFKLDGMSYGFFIPIFFIMVGVNLDLSGIAEVSQSVPLILTITAGFFITQVIPSLIMARIFGWEKALSGGILLAARLGETIAVAQIGLSLGVISGAENAGIVMASILSSIIAPLTYKMFKQKKDSKHHIYILGGTRASLLLAERFKMHDISCLTLLQKDELVPEFEHKDLLYKYVEKLTINVIDGLKLRVSDLVIVLTESRNLNLELTRHIKNELNHGRIITRRQSTAHDLIDVEESIKIVDADAVLASHIESMVVRPDSVSSLSQSFDAYRIEEIPILNGFLHGKLVREIAFPPQGSLVIQRRGGEIFIPHGNTKLLKGDVMTVIGNTNALSEFRDLLQDRS